MKVLKRGIMPDGTKIQIEDWHDDYSFMPYGRTVAAYAKSKMSHPGSFSPKGNELYRFEFDFASNVEADAAFDELVSGAKLLPDFKSLLTRKEYADCL